MAANGSPSHRASDARRNRLIAIGAGILLAIILLLSLLAYCTNRNDAPPTAGGPSSSAPSQPDYLPGEPGSPSPGASPGVSPGGGGPGGGGPGGVSPGPGGGGPGEGGPGGGPSDEPTTAKPTPVRSPTPSGGVDTGGGGLLSGQRVALLVTGGFLLIAAAGAAAYALRKPLHHR